MPSIRARLPRWRRSPTVSPARTPFARSRPPVSNRHEARAEDPEDLLHRKLEDYQRRFRLLDDQMRVLERERQKLSAVVNHTDAGFLVFDASLCVTWTNNIFATRFCASP